MTPEAVAAALFPPDKRIFRKHFGGNVLKAYRCLIYRHLKYLSQAINHTGGSYCLYYWTTLTLYLQQIQAEQRKNLELG